MYCQGNSGQDFTIEENGGAGTIMTLDSMEDTAFTPLIPGAYTLPKDGKTIAQYINSTKYDLEFFNTKFVDDIVKEYSKPNKVCIIALP